MTKDSSIIITIFLISIFTFITLLSLPQSVESSEITLIAGGDVAWCLVVKAPEIYYDGKKRNKWERIYYRVARKMGIGKRDWIRMPYLATPQSKNYIEKKFNRKLETPNSHHINAIQYGLKFNSLEEKMVYPFQKIRPVLLEADIAFVNLEAPLSDHSRFVGNFKTPTAFAKALKWAGIDVVSTANNHALDTEGAGLIETKQVLMQENIGTVGSGMDISDARRPYVIEKKGISVAFLGYSQYTVYGGSGFALKDRSGIVPLDPFVIMEDIQRIRKQVNYVILSFHWGFEGNRNIHPEARKFAHLAIDAGADVILGHGTHLPQGVEIYNEKLIIYSLGNFIFGHNHEHWIDNFLARLILSPDQIKKIEIIPISGQGKNLAQPHKLKGEAARNTLRNIKILTEELNTKMTIEEDLGIVFTPTKLLSN